MVFKKGLMVLLSVSMLIPAVLFAHPAKDTVLSFDAKTKTLKVSVLHDSRDNKKHFIEEVIVSINGKVMIKQNFNSQTSNTNQDAVYILNDAKPADEIAVKSECNLGGVFEKKLAIK